MAQYLTSVAKISVLANSNVQQKLIVTPDTPFFIQNIGDETIYFGTEDACFLKLEPTNTIGSFIANNSNELYVMRATSLPESTYEVAIMYISEVV